MRRAEIVPINWTALEAIAGKDAKDYRTFTIWRTVHATTVKRLRCALGLKSFRKTRGYWLIGSKCDTNWVVPGRIKGI